FLERFRSLASGGLSGDASAHEKEQGGEEQEEPESDPGGGEARRRFHGINNAWAPPATLQRNAGSHPRRTRDIPPRHWVCRVERSPGCVRHPPPGCVRGWRSG